MNLVNRHQESLIVTWGGLLYLLREREFVREDGTYLDDDMDTLASTGTYQLLLDHEPQLWDKFGWTMRMFLNCENETVFGQLVSACGHKYKTKPGKAKQMYPAVELYPYQIADNGTVVQDVWEDIALPAKLVLPPIHIPFYSKGTNETLNLQIPRHGEKILSCFYGNWRIPATGYRGADRRDKYAQCFQESLAELQ